MQADAEVSLEDTEMKSVSKDEAAGKPASARPLRRTSPARHYGFRNSIFVSIAILLNHVIFLFAQLAGGPMEVRGGLSAAVDPLYWASNSLFMVEMAAHASFSVEPGSVVESLLDNATDKLCAPNPFQSGCSADDCDPDQISHTGLSLCTTLECGYLSVSKTVLQVCSRVWPL